MGLEKKFKSITGGGEEVNSSLFALKGFCAILVVFIHVRGIGKETFLVLPLMRIAVPCFYMISGYFLFRDNRWSVNAIIKQLKKIGRLLLITTFIYILFFIAVNLIKGNPAITENWQTWTFVQRWFVYGDNLCYPLWYLTAYIQSLLLLLLIKMCRMQKVAMLLTPVLLICSVLLNRYSFLLTQESFDVTMSRNAWFCALPCVMSGIMIRQNEAKLLRNNWTKPLLLLAFLAYIEYFILGYLHVDGSGADYNLFTYPLAIITIIWCVQHPNLSQHSNRFVSMAVLLGRNHSTNIYLLHIMMLSMVELLVFFVPAASLLRNAEIVVILSILCSFLINKSCKELFS